MNPHPLPSGKLPPSLLASLIAALPTDSARLLLGPKVGEDAAVIEFGVDDERLLVVKSDPITFATAEIGYYAVNVCANDLAVTGAQPLFYLPTILLPADATTAGNVTAIFAQIGAACHALGIVVIGGHTEVTYTVTSPVVAGTMLGEVLRAQVVSSAGARPGDLILLAGVVPVEGVSIIAREKEADLLARGWGSEELTDTANYLFEPGISVLVPALAAAERGLVTAMHDPTEGGVAGGLSELATAAAVGLHIDLDAIPIPEVARRLCETYALDPLGTIASGALLATCRPEHVTALRSLWQELGWPSVPIGHVLPVDEGLNAVCNGKATPFPTFAVDEIARLFSP